jgi:hypothetical protein
MLTDPRAALAEQNDVVTALTGLAGLAGLVRGLAAERGLGSRRSDADDVVYLLLGIAGLGAAVERLAGGGQAPPEPSDVRENATEWLR